MPEGFLSEKGQERTGCCSNKGTDGDAPAWTKKHTNGRGEYLLSYTKFYVLTHNAQNLMEGLDNVDPHIGGNELHCLCYNQLERRWLDWSGGYHVPIKDTTLRGIKVHAAIAGKDFIGLAEERDAIIGHFMKPHGKSRELVFKSGRIDLAVVIDPVDFKGAKDERVRVYELDDDDNIIGRKVCIHNLAVIVLSHSSH